MSTDFIKNQVMVHSSALLRYANKFTKNEDDAEDLVQNTLLKVYKYRSKFVKETNVLGWMYTIMKNTFLNDCRRNSLVLKYMDHAKATQNINNASVSNNGEGMFIQKEIQNALESLPEIYYKPFIMHFEGYKYHEIAKYFNIPEGTIKTRIHAARKALQNKLKEHKLNY